MSTANMYLVDTESERTFPVTVIRTATDQRILNCNLVFNTPPVEPSEFLNMSPSLRAYQEKDAPNSSWYLCESQEDVAILLRQDVPDIRYLFRKNSEGVSIIPVQVQTCKAKDAFSMTADLLDLNSTGVFMRHDQLFSRGTVTDVDGGVYHPTLRAPDANILDDPDPNMRLYDSLAFAEAAADRERAIIRIRTRLDNLENFGTTTLQSMADILDGSVPVPEKK